jgi:hypothetical protein
MKRILAVLLFGILMIPSLALAQKPEDPATKEDVRQFFKVVMVRRQMDAVLTAMRQQMPRMMADVIQKSLPNATPEEMEKLNGFFSDQYSQMAATMPIEEMLEAMIPAYQKHLTHGDLQELIGFYTSPLGKRIVSEMPVITTEAMQYASPVIQKWAEAETVKMSQQAAQFAESLRHGQNSKPVSH